MVNIEDNKFIKKKNGVFYTPENVAGILSNWAIQSPEDTVLEPSFGGCHFIKASKKRLIELSCQNPEKQLFGCDIDPNAFIYLDQVLNLSNINGNFIKNDFLRLDRKSFPIEDFNIIIGNPPYVSHHNMSSEQIQTAQRALHEFNCKLDGRSSLWAYFVIHSMRFLADGGRMAWILPSSFLYSDYSNIVKKIISLGFSNSLIIYLGERLFIKDGTEEISVIVLCKGRNLENHVGEMIIKFAPDVNKLESIIKNWESGSLNGSHIGDNPRLVFLPKDSQLIYTELSSMNSVKNLGDICQIKIGIVSGANDFFIIDMATAKEKNLPKSVLQNVLTRFNHTNGLVFSSDDMLQLEKDGHKCLLVDATKTSSIDGALKLYMESFPKRLLERTTFSRRMKSGTWYKFNDDNIPDAFFPYMRTKGPAIVLNEAKVNSINSIHRVYFHDTINIDIRKSIAISILSSFSQLSAEIEGRTYGAGVLKLEPSEALRIRLFLPEIHDPEIINRTFKSLNSLIKNGELNKARALADQFIFFRFSDRQRKRYKEILLKAIEQTRSQRLP